VRVLSILPFPVLPLTHGGRVRAYRLAVGLAGAGASVDLCCPWHPAFPLRPFEREGIMIRPFVFAANALPALLGDRIVPPLLQLSWQPFTIGPRHLLRSSGSYDIVEFHFCAYASWMRRVPGRARVVYSAHNVERDYALAERPSGLRRRLASGIAKLERDAVHASDLVVTCTEVDGTRLGQLYGEPSRLAVVSNGYDEGEIRAMTHLGREEARAELGLDPEELAILFIGGPAVHNRRAVRFLEEELLPALERPARLVIAGQCVEPRREGRVLALGFVERLHLLLTAADVAVNPIESGSGSNVKLAEYVAAGLPVITTPLGLRGYEAFAPLVTVAELDRFAEAVQAAHRVGVRRPHLDHLRWSALGRRLHEVYGELIAQRSRPRLAC
jgi:glycosyltransferase involved in cell wall biosynthesis